MERSKLLGLFPLPDRTVCSACSAAWTSRLLGRWSFTGGPACVRVRGWREAGQGDRIANNKTGHNMITSDNPWPQCLAGQTEQNNDC